MDDLVPLPIVVPLIAAAALSATGHFLGKSVDDVAGILTATACAVLSTLLVLRSLDHDLVYWFGGWTPRNGVAIGIAFDVEPLGAALAAFAGFVTLAAFVFAWRYFDEVGTLFHVLLLVFLAGVTGFVLSGDLFNMFVFFELMSVCAFALVGSQIRATPPLQGAVNFGVVNTIGSFLFLSGIALVYGRTGALNLAQIGRALDAHPPDTLVLVAFALLVAGFLVKAGAVPFHFWLSDAYAAAAIPVCVLLAAVMSDLGVHAVARVYWPAFSGTLAASSGSVRGLLVGVGVLTALLGAAMTFLERDLKRMLAFLTVSHVGVFLCGVGLLTASGLAGSTLYVIADGCVKGALFLAVGILIVHVGSGDELELRGRGRQAVSASAVLLAGGLLTAGVPPLGSFLGWSLIVRSSADVGYTWLPPVLMIALIVTGGTVLRAAGRIAFGWGDEEDPLLSPEPSPTEDEPDVPKSRLTRPLLIGPPIALLVAGIAVGIAPGLGDQATAWAQRLQDRPAHAAEVLEGKVPPPLPPVPVEAGATPYVYSVASLAGGLAFALFGLYRRRLPSLLRGGAGAFLDAPVVVLKRVHSGVVGDYVAWLTFGVAALGGLLVLLGR